MNTSNIYNKHLNRELRDLIELGLDNGDNFVTIAKNINKKNNTISYEIKKHRVFSKGNHFNITDDSYLICSKLEKPPYVCNGCPSKKGCRKHKYFYRAKDAQEEYEYDLKDSRIGINMNIQEFKNLNKIVTTEIKNGHSFSMICMNHKDEFPVKNTLGNELFYKFFPVILTDNGKEFFNPDFIEDNGPEINKTRVFYCDPRASQQKGKIENNHEYIRRYLSKGKSFDQYEQDTFTLISNHINSTSRELFDGKAPYEVMNFFNPEFMDYFNIQEIEKTKVVLNYKLLKQIE